MHYDKTDRPSANVVDETQPSMLERISQVVWGPPAFAPEDTRALEGFKEYDGPPADLSVFKRDSDRIIHNIEEQRKKLEIGDDGKPILETQDLNSLPRNLAIYADRLASEGKIGKPNWYIGPPKVLEIPPLP
jgi:hypothetical protein